MPEDLQVEELPEKQQKGGNPEDCHQPHGPAADNLVGSPDIVAFPPFSCLCHANFLSRMPCFPPLCRPGDFPANGKDGSKKSPSYSLLILWACSAEIFHCGVDAVVQRGQELVQYTGLLLLKGYGAVPL